MMSWRRSPAGPAGSTRARWPRPQWRRRWQNRLQWRPCEAMRTSCETSFWVRQRRRSSGRNRKLRAADWITLTRLAIVPALWPFALAGNSKVVAAGLIAAGVLDAADGFVARRLRQPTLAGARLDAVADSVLMLSVTAWLGILHPVLLTGDALLWLPV